MPVINLVKADLPKPAVEPQVRAAASAFVTIQPLVPFQNLVPSEDPIVVRGILKDEELLRTTPEFVVLANLLPLFKSKSRSRARVSSDEVAEQKSLFSNLPTETFRYFRNLGATDENLQGLLQLIQDFVDFRKPAKLAPLETMFEKVGVPYDDNLIDAKLTLMLPHWGESDPDKVMYFKTLRDLMNNNPSATTPGRFLTRVLGLTCNVDAAAQFYKTWADDSAFKVRYVDAADREGWLTAYSSKKNSSCMRSSPSVYVYAPMAFGLPDNNLRLAWIGEDLANASSRCIVNIVDKTYSRHYGDNVIVDILKRDGFKSSSRVTTGVVFPLIRCGLVRDKNAYDNRRTILREVITHSDMVDVGAYYMAPYFDNDPHISILVNKKSGEVLAFSGSDSPRGDYPMREWEHITNVSSRSASGAFSIDLSYVLSIHNACPSRRPCPDE